MKVQNFHSTSRIISIPISFIVYVTNPVNVYWCLSTFMHWATHTHTQFHPLVDFWEIWSAIAIAKWNVTLLKVIFNYGTLNRMWIFLFFMFVSEWTQSKSKNQKKKQTTQNRCEPMLLCQIFLFAINCVCVLVFPHNFLYERKLRTKVLNIKTCDLEDYQFGRKFVMRFYFFFLDIFSIRSGFFSLFYFCSHPKCYKTSFYFLLFIQMAV